MTLFLHPPMTLQHAPRNGHPPRRADVAALPLGGGEDAKRGANPNHMPLPRVPENWASAQGLLRTEPLISAISTFPTNRPVSAVVL